MEQLLRDIKDNAVGNLSTQIAQQLTSLKGLAVHLQDIKRYLTNVLSGKLPVNHQIIYNLQNIFNLLPDLHQPDMARGFSVKTNDELLIIYLSSLIRAIIALHNLIENKIMNQTAEKGGDKVGVTL